MMKKGSSVGVGAWCLVVVMVVLAAEVHKTAAVTCNAKELTPCLPAISGSGDPSKQCCAKLREQEPCFCTYLKNPALKPYINSPNAQKVAKYCGVTIPKC